MSNTKEFVIDWRIILSVVVVFMVVCIGVFGVWALSQYGLRSSPTSPPTISIPPTETPIILSDEEALNVAEEAAIAYFTVDYSNQAAWLDSFRGFTDPGGMSVLEKNAVSVLWPKLESAKVKSRATLVASEKIVFGIDGIKKTKWQICRISVKMDKSWPSGDTIGFGPITLPWANGDRATVYVSIGEVDGRWQFSMFPAENLVATMVDAATQSP